MLPSVEQPAAAHYTVLSALCPADDLPGPQKQEIRRQISSVIDAYDNPALLTAALVSLHTLDEEQYHYPSPGVPFTAVAKHLDVPVAGATAALTYALHQKLIETDEEKEKKRAKPRYAIKNIFYPLSSLCTLFGERTLLKRAWLTPPEALRMMKEASTLVEFVYHKQFTFSQETMQDLRERSLSGLEAVYEAEMDFLREICDVPEKYRAIAPFGFIMRGENACRNCKKTLPTTHDFRASFASIGEAFSAGFDAATGMLRDVYTATGEHLPAISVRGHDGRYDLSLENTAYAAAQACTFAIQQKNREILKELQGKLEKTLP